MNTAQLFSGHPYFVHWGVIQISLPNLIVVLVMLVLFVLALILPFPGGRGTPFTSPATPEVNPHDD